MYSTRYKTQILKSSQSAEGWEESKSSIAL